MEAAWRWVFWVAAFFNFAVGIPMLAAPGTMLELIGATADGELTFHRLAGLLVACFGVIYALVAGDLARYRPLVWLAVAGKIGVAALFVGPWLDGKVGAPAFALAMGDLAFGIAFASFLATYRRRPQ